MTAVEAASSLIIGTSINFETTSKSIEEILKQMQILNSTEVTSNELNTAKKYIAGSFVRSIETIQQLSSFLSLIALFALDDNYFENYLYSISKLTPGNLFEAQRLYFSPENLAIAVPAKSKLRNILKEFGNIEVLKF